LAAKDLISPEEIEILKPFKDSLPQGLFERVYYLPVNDGSGMNRRPLHEASQLLKKAGWVISNGKLTHSKHLPMKIEIIISSPTYERILQGYARNLERLGIECLITVLDSATYQKRMDNFDFEMTLLGVDPVDSPGNEQRELWGSAAARIQGGHNYMGVENPIVDSLIEKIIEAENRKDLVTVSKALDRVLLWNDYAVPGWYSNTFRLAYWDKFERPKIRPKYSLGLDYWWMK
jgi:microcin C transport system substrate-binding protein